MPIRRVLAILCLVSASMERERLIGRAESIREGYLDKFTQRRADMLSLAGELGWRFVSHVTSEEARTPLGLLAHGFAQSGAAA